MREPIPSSETKGGGVSTLDRCHLLLLKQIDAVLLRLPTLPRFNISIRTLSKAPPPLRPHTLLLYARMTRLGLPTDHFTYPSLLTSCTSFSHATEVHSRALRSGHLASLHVSNALLHAYGKLDLLPLARKVFDEMPLRDLVTSNALLCAHARLATGMALAREVFNGMPHRNVISWNAMALGYANSGSMALAREVFNGMPARNIVSWNTMLVGYVKNGDVDAARELFDQMQERNLVSWAALISGYAQNGRPHEALHLFADLKRTGLVPDAATMIGVISSTAQLGDPHLANRVGSYVNDRTGIDRNARILTGLVDMHAKCGNAEEACRLFEDIPTKDAFSYTALINGLSSHGYGGKALELFARMQREGVRPDGVTYVGVLSACSHGGLVDEGVGLWDMMVNWHGIEPCSDHYACLVDMLGRAGKLKEAHEMVRRMPNGPHAGTLGALLSACRGSGEVETAEAVAEELFEIEPENTGNYMLLWGIYAARDEWDKARRLRERMRKKGIRKLLGASWM